MAKDAKKQHVLRVYHTGNPNYSRHWLFFSMPGIMNGTVSYKGLPVLVRAALEAKARG